MLRENTRIIKRIHRSFDLLITAASFVAAYFIKRDLLPSGVAGLTTGPNYYVVLLAIIIIWYVCFNWVRLYGSFREHPLSWYFVNIVKACLAGLTVFKWCVIQALQRLRSKGYNTRNVLIVGSQTRASAVIRSIDEARHGGYLVLGCFDTEQERIGQPVVNGYRVLGVLPDLKAYLEHNVVDELIFAMPLRKIETRTSTRSGSAAACP